jgi:hypothetical protein
MATVSSSTSSSSGSAEWGAVRSSSQALLTDNERRAVRMLGLLDRPQFAAWMLAALMGIDDEAASRIRFTPLLTDAARFDDLIPEAWHHVERYANDPIEADHRVQPEVALDRCDQGGPLVVAGEGPVRSYEPR